MSDKSTKGKKRAARNFIKTYGAETFYEFLRSIAQGESGQDIALRLNVSRERVRQWKNLFGTIHIEYRVDPHVAAILREARKK
jgi:DNA-binding NarL/FixJ family response regulator